jgi:hypothetical protein
MTNNERTYWNDDRIWFCEACFEALSDSDSYASEDVNHSLGSLNIEEVFDAELFEALQRDFDEEARR